MFNKEEIYKIRIIEADKGLAYFTVLFKNNTFKEYLFSKEDASTLAIKYKEQGNIVLYYS